MFLCQSLRKCSLDCLAFMIKSIIFESCDFMILCYRHVRVCVRVCACARTHTHAHIHTHIRYGMSEHSISYKIAFALIEDSDQPAHLRSLTRPRGYKTFFMLNSAEHEICLANKSQITDNSNIFLA